MDIQEARIASGLKLKKLVDARHAPSGNTHEAEWAAKYLGVSTIVKLTAEEYAQRLLKQKRILAKDPTSMEWSDPGEPFFGFKGNTLAAESYADFDAHEVRAQVAIPETPAVLRGHADAAKVIDGFVWVGEHKAFVTGNFDKNEAAVRQGALCLALMRAEIEAALEASGGFASYIFDSADWAPDAKRFTWMAAFKIGGVLRSIVEEYPPTSNEAFPLDEAALDQTLAYYLDKAQAIWFAVERDDVECARVWDQAHPDEFLRVWADLGSGPGEIAPLAAAKRDILDAEKKLKEEKERLDGELLFALDELKLPKLSVSTEDGRVFNLGIRLSGGKEFVAIDDARRMVEKLRGAGLDGYADDLAACIQMTTQGRWCDVKETRAKKVATEE